ncbi:dihydrolipoyl dehydrogenase [Bartonella bacilliformis str. Heidi Mejia]|uniref:dihydrolipoyl dehydrogenase n=1 Tax=Bartonella bacilliformis TaxID=774 RepID=UPI0004501A8F|nr:dihydrolipoyl dehydrogenase [Bartonella bacilliformis]EYS90797.1 dihydrolipoyl dehydrogenase [Bartonella bacilliformis str. Heidi Mejia]EYS95538.1 dihydrolipoyl dehydrogenase [Bartonella bacilliformis Peru-18]KEG18385.1 dihydrolipoyl dehydrogenase [Bartonella bacilliformis CUSCO5]KEG20602.1 dihydrolipoyl dehydrogenase [Bartonella bacilliformis Hosp800-02]KEG25009.1 dihydrolipoyl dehydrogenase [Bartonella bacilliformis VAB9028]
MSYDVVIIGAGPGGYVAAIKAAQLGLKTAIIEKRETLGGTCLNVGCIPSKALLHASEVFAEAQHGFDTLGISVSKPQLNLEKMMAHKKSVVAANTSGISFLMRKNKIDTFFGTAKILGAGQVAIFAKDGNQQTIVTKNIVIATGSDISGIPGVNVEIDEKVIVSSTGALALEKVPTHMVVIGAGVIGSELGSVWSRLGAKVTVIEFLDKVLGSIDGEVSRHFQKIMEKQGIEYKLGTKVTAVAKSGSRAKISFEAVKGGASETLETDVVLIATGRRPYVDGLGLAEAGVQLDGRGFIAINEHWQTNIPGIYAIGDVVKGPMLAHKAEEEGVAVAEILAGQKGHVNFDVIPSVVYTQPEIASVGKTEEELKAAGIAYNVGKFPFMANGRARAMQKDDGFVKILADKNTDRLLGGHILGFGAGEMIHEIAVLMEFGGSSEDLSRCCHAHPTLSEAVREAALATFFKPLHI